MPKVHKVRQGECLCSISVEHGHFWETVWEHGDNAALKEDRKDPNVLFPGDALHIPDLRERVEDCATDKRHTFRRKGVPTRLVITLSDGWEVIKNQPFTLEVHGVEHKGETDDEGKIDVPVPPSANAGTLIVGEDGKLGTFDLKIGRLDPVTEPEGIEQRLANLGYAVKFDDEEEEILQSLAAFQADHEIEATGKLDDETKAKLEEIYGR